MKRVGSVILALILFIAAFAGCGEKKQEPLRICLDLDYMSHSGSAWDEAEVALKTFLSHVEDLGGPTDVVIECVSDGYFGERESALQRLRTEIMAGNGPDLYIMACDDEFGMDTEGLFVIPEKVMETGLFLSLDQYMEQNAKFTEWNKLLEPVMAAGRNEYGQQIVPLAYTLPVTFYREADTNGIKPGAETTWQDMLEDKTGVLAAASTWYHSNGIALQSEEGGYLDYTLGELADYKNEDLLFTKEELQRRIEEIIAMKKQYSAGEVPAAPAHFQCRLYHDYDAQSAYDKVYADGINPFANIETEEPQTMVPIYSDDGGVTATITHYAAISANTKRAEDAFFILDVLMSLDSQQYADLYGDYILPFGGVPLHEDAMSEAYPMRHMSRFYFRGENFEEFCRLREQITHTQFSNSITVVLRELYLDCLENGITEEKIERAYRKMEIMLRE